MSKVNCTKCGKKIEPEYQCKCSGGSLREENASLKAEVERLKEEKEGLGYEVSRLESINHAKLAQALADQDLLFIKAKEGLEDARSFIAWNSHKEDCKPILLRLQQTLEEIKG